MAALEAAYARGESDEFVSPAPSAAAAASSDGDAVVFMNFRADRARQLTVRLRARAIFPASRASPSPPGRASSA
jgi:bisphosphoglycerate-independent phosphoglycerate mutase (AlkP superfamily)